MLTGWGREEKEKEIRVSGFYLTVLPCYMVVMCSIREGTILCSDPALQEEPQAVTLFTENIKFVVYFNSCSVGMCTDTRTRNKLHFLLRSTGYNLEIIGFIQTASFSSPISIYSPS